MSTSAPFELEVDGQVLSSRALDPKTAAAVRKGLAELRVRGVAEPFSAQKVLARVLANTQAYMRPARRLVVEAWLAGRALTDREAWLIRALTFNQKIRERARERGL